MSSTESRSRSSPSTARALAIMMTHADPYAARDGGSLRSRGFADVLRSSFTEVDILYPSRTLGTWRPQGGRGVLGGMPDRLRAVKRRYLPMPTAIGARDVELRREVSERAGDLIVIAGLSHVPYARRFSGRVWVDFMDLWSQAGLREAAHRRGVAAATTRVQARALRRGEARIAELATLVTAAGWGDNLTLRKRGIDSHWLPTALPDREFGTVPRRTSNTPPAAGFFGNFDYPPNRDAYQLLVREWLPWFRRAGYLVVIAGRGSAGLGAPPEGVENLGPVGPVDDFYARVSVTLAPVRLGGGIKVKVIESLARGIPVVGTAFAFDGFPPDVAPMVRECRVDGSDLGDALRGPLPRVDPGCAQLRPYRISRADLRLTALLDRVV